MAILKVFRLSIKLVNRLSLLAKATHKSEAFLVTNALTHYLEDYADVQIAKIRFNDPKSKIISGVKLRKRLGV